ncbi:MAG: cytochrome P450 [Candidatus Binatus sp.]|jgi:pimeloyl-[acyl-carrier protein] synthase
MRVAEDSFPTDVDPTLPGHPDPYPLLHRLRTDDPVHFSAFINGWVLTRYADAITFLRDRRFSRVAFLDKMRAKFGDQPILDLQAGELAFNDPPNHTALKGLAAKAFSPNAIAAARPNLEARVEEVLDGLAGAGRMDVIADFAYPLPADAISAMVGVPREDWKMLRGFVDGVILSRGIVRTPAMMAEGDRSARQFIEYLRALVKERRVRPQADLMSAMMAVEERGLRLTDDQVVTMAEQLFTAGHGTTRNLIGSALLALMQNPQEFKRLRENPQLIESAIEEALRYDSPTQAPNPQVATDDLEIGGRKISSGEVVTVLIGAANRDPAKFPDPDSFDVARADGEHLAFSHGAHYCLGASLARLQAQIAVGAIVRRMPRLRLGTDQLKWKTMGRFRGLESLPVQF